MKGYLLDRHLIDLENNRFEIFPLVGRFMIGTAILWPHGEVFHIIEVGGPKIKDVLLLLIHPITLTASILILCMAILVLRVGRTRISESDPVEA